MNIRILLAIFIGFFVGAILACIWGHEKEPAKGVSMFRNTGGRIVEVGVIKFNWQDSLTKV